MTSWGQFLLYELNVHISQAHSFSRDIPLAKLAACLPGAAPPPFTGTFQGKPKLRFWCATGKREKN